jgi:phosphoesterase RecJ-like protein
MHFECDNRIAWFVLTRDLLEKSGAEDWETDGFSELPRNIGDVEVCIMFTEKNASITKVSFRSKGRIVVSELARKFGGGGHKFASGVTLSMELQQATEKIIHEAIHLVENHR